MAAPAIRVEGLRDVLRQLEAFGVETDDLRDAFGEIAGDVAEQAASGVRIRTRALHDTIRPARTKNKAIVRAGTAGVPYAGVVNYERPGDEFLTGPANEDPEAKVRQIEANLDTLIRKRRLG